MKTSTPQDHNFSPQPEWTPHQRCWIAWPTESENESWYGQLQQARYAYAQLVRTIAHFEPVTLICHPNDAQNANLTCGPNIPILRLNINESWIRDIGPTFLVNPSQHLAGVHWQFNHWGTQNNPSSTTPVGRHILQYLNAPIYDAPFVLEGGAFHVNGNGILLTTETCLLHPNRNPTLSKSQIETLLHHYTNCQQIIWLPHGYDQDDTNGHIDAVACFVQPHVILVASTNDPNDSNYSYFKENLQCLKAVQKTSHLPLEIITLQQPPPVYAHGVRQTYSYINYYVANGAVIVPIFDTHTDQHAITTLQKLYPDRTIVPFPCKDIVLGGGGIHCITLNQPLSQ